MRQLVFGLVLIFMGMSTAISGPFDDGLDAYKRGEYELAVQYFRNAADMGDARAQFGLGFLYRDGKGVPQDYAEATSWFRKAAEQGDANAQFNLGQMYREGKGVPLDYVEAADWYRKAANQGTARAQINLGIMYAKGEGVPQDYVHAHLWFNLATVRGNAEASKNRDKVAGNMTPEQIAEAQRLAREWKPSN